MTEDLSVLTACIVKASRLRLSFGRTGKPPYLHVFGRLVEADVRGTPLAKQTQVTLPDKGSVLATQTFCSQHSFLPRTPADLGTLNSPLFAGHDPLDEGLEAPGLLPGVAEVAIVAPLDQMDAKTASNDLASLPKHDYEQVFPVFAPPPPQPRSNSGEWNACPSSDVHCAGLTS